MPTGQGHVLGTVDKKELFKGFDFLYVNYYHNALQHIYLNMQWFDATISPS